MPRLFQRPQGESLTSIPNVPDVREVVPAVSGGTFHERGCGIPPSFPPPPTDCRIRLVQDPTSGGIRAEVSWPGTDYAVAVAPTHEEALIAVVADLRRRRHAREQFSGACTCGADAAARADEQRRYDAARAAGAR